VLREESCLLAGIAPGIPPLKRSAKLVIEDLHANLQKRMCATWRPSHLLLLHEALCHELIDRRFDKPGRDALATSAPLYNSRSRPPM
jgi:hypothetical protein